MKLAEALQNRVLLAQQIKDLQEAISSNIWTTEGEEPETSLDSMLTELTNLRKTLSKLILDINISNTLCGLTALISERDMLKASSTFAQGLVSTSSSNQVSRYGGSGGTKYKRNLSPVVARETYTKLSRELIALDTKIQELNWSVELTVS